MNCMKDVISGYRKSVSSIAEKNLEIWMQNKEDIDTVFNMLSDDDSRLVYAMDLQFCMLGNFMPSELAATISGNMTDAQLVEYINKAKGMWLFSEIANPNTYLGQLTKYQCCATTFLLEQYRYKNFVKINRGDVCIDAGSCLGDTAMYFIQNGAEHVYSFETDKDNVALMQKTLKNFNVEDKVTIVNKAVANEVGQTFFTPTPENTGAGTISAERSETSYLVEMTKIDLFCKENDVKPTFIKMDIEGAEPEALEGARETIIKCRPKCAICIYHYVEHRWQIPLLFRDMVEDYDFYVKKSAPCAETVFFAKPR